MSDKKSEVIKDQHAKSEFIRDKPEEIHREMLEEEFDERIRFELAMTQKYEEENKDS